MDLNTFTWSQLPKLPEEAWTSTFIVDGQDLVLVNPYHNNLMVLNGTEFSLVPGHNARVNITELGESGKFATVVAVGDAQLHECH